MAISARVESPLTLLITGGSGFIGTNVVQWAVQQGHAVYNFDIAPPRNPAHAAHWLAGDVLDGATLAAVLRDHKPDVVLHLAARTDLFGGNASDYKANTTGVSRIIEAVTNSSSVKRSLMASSLLVCRLGYLPEGPDDYSPDTAYGESKVAGERLVRSADPSGRDFVVFRPTSIWGPWFGRPYRDFFESVVKRRYVHPGRSRIQRSYGFVGNAVAQLAELMGADQSILESQPYYLADYEPTEIKVWADQINAELGRGPVATAPLWLFKVAAAIGDGAQAVGVAPPLTSRRLRNMLTPAVYDCGPMQRLCPTLPYERRTAIRETLAWLAGAA